MKTIILHIAANLSKILLYAKKTLLFLNTEPIVISSMLVGLTNGIMRKFIEKWVFSDFDFLGFLFIMVIIDTGLGALKAWKTNTINSTGWGGFITKVIVYSLLLWAVHTITHFTVKGKHPVVLDWADYVFYTGLIIREFISVLENVGKIYPKLIPAWIKAKLEKLNNETPVQ